MNTQINDKEETDLNDPVNNSDTDAKPQEKELLLDQILDPEMPRMVRWVIKYSGGIIKDEKQASFVLLGFIVVAIIVSLFLLFGGNGGSENQNNLMIPAEL